MNDRPGLKRRDVLLGLAGCLLFPVSTEASDWVKLGERRVRLVADYDVIPVTILRGDFRRVQLRVRENGVFFESITLVYGNGARDSIPVRRLIPAGGESRVINLRGGDRVIRSVQLNYRSVRDNDGRALVRIFGRR